MRLGDEIKRALNAVGITEEYVKAWLGNCKCDERRKRLNELSEWAIKFLGLQRSEIVQAEIPSPVTSQIRGCGLCRNRSRDPIYEVDFGHTGRLRAKVFSCSVFGECVMARGVADKHACAGCDRCET